MHPVISNVKKKRFRKCKTPYCRVRIDTKSNRHPTRPKCYARLRKERNPYGYFYQKLKDRAGERGHSFTLTVVQFTCFCKIFSLFKSRGRGKGCLSIDRKDPLHGYHMWNIRPLEYAENSRRAHVPYLQQMKEVEQPF